MKTHLKILTILVALTTLCSCRQDVQQAEHAIVTDTIPNLVIQVRQCSRLYTTEYKIHKVVTHDDVVRLKGNIMTKDFDIQLPLGERKIAIPMTATLKAYIDFKDFSEKNIEHDGDRITITLPDPQVTMTSSKIDQKEIREYVGFARSHFSDREMSNYEQQGRKAILNSVAQLGIIESAQENAARVLIPMLAEMGYKEKNITITFRKDLNILELINSDIEKP